MTISIFFTKRQYTLQIFWCTLSFIILSSCNSHSGDASLLESNLLRDYIHGDSVNHSLISGDDLRDQLEYEKAIHNYRSILNDKQEGGAEYVYLLNQIVFCGLSLREFSLVEQEYRRLSDLNDLEPNAALDRQINNGILLKVRGEHLKSKEVFLSVLEKTDNPKKQIVLNDHLSEVYFRLNGLVDSTYYYLKRAFRISEEHLKASPVWYNLSIKIVKQHIIRREYIGGLAFLEEVLSLAREKEPEYVALALLLKGKIHRKNQEPEMAKLAYDESLDISRGVEDLETSKRVFQELMIYYADDSDSVNFFSLKAELETLGDHHTLRAIGNFSTGFYYFNLRQFQKSAGYFEEYLSQTTRNENPELEVVMQALNLLVECKKKIGAFEEAEQLMREIITFGSNLYSSGSEFDSLFGADIINKKYNFFAFSGLASHYLESYKRDFTQVNLLQRAFRIYKALDQVIPQQLTMSEEDAFLRLVGQAGSIYADATETAFHLQRLDEDNDVLMWSGRFMERGRGLRLLSEVNHDLNAIEQIPDSLLFKERALYSQIANQKMLRQTGVSEALKTKELIEKQENLSEYIQNQYPNYYRLKYNQNIPTPEVVQSILLKGKGAPDGVIGYQMSQTNLFVQVYGTWGTRLIRLKLDSSFHNALGTYQNHFDQRTLVPDDQSFHAFTAAAYTLYKKLIAPWRSWFSEEADNFVLVTDGTLSQINFDALLKSKVTTGHTDYRLDYLVNEMNFSFSLSVTGFVSHYNQTQRDRDFSSVLGYAYSSQESLTDGGAHFEELEGTLQELNTIKKLSYSNFSTFRYGDEATKQQFLSDIKAPFDIVHLGLHASSSSFVKEDNRILFRNSSKTGVSSALFGFELAMNPITARLAVLSACDSGKGTFVKGGGTYSLVRSFMMAGVKEVIASRWTLPDKSGSKIMGYFYDGLLRSKKRPDEALHQAKLSYLANSSKYKAHPYFWAGLTLSKN